MRITRVVYTHGNCGVTFHSKGRGEKSYLATCAIIFDDCFRINDVRLFCKESLENAYLVLPSRQDTFREVSVCNKKYLLSMPKWWSKINTPYCEYYHPLKTDFYKYMLQVVLEGYKSCLKDGSCVYHPRRLYG